MAYRSCKQNAEMNFRSSEHGALFVLVVFVMAVLLAIAGLAIDAGNLYRVQLRLQAAADAGALGGITSTILQNEFLNPQSAADVKAFVEDRGRQLAYHNLLHVGIVVDPATEITSVYEYRPPPGAAPGSPGIPTLSVSVTTSVALLLMHAVPFDMFGVQGPGATLPLGAAAADAVAQRKPANVLLVTDTSRSMACPATGECDCLKLGRTQECEDVTSAPGMSSKLEVLQEAVQAFLDQFDENIDRIGLVPFNIVGSLDNNYAAGGAAVPLNTANPPGAPYGPLGFDRADFIAAMDNFSATSDTNICDGFIRAYEEASRAGFTDTGDVRRDQEVAYLLFSDGAPTAGRFFYNEPNTLPPSAIAGRNFGARDYTAYDIHWQQDPADPVETEGPEWYGPSPLVETSKLNINYNNPVPPLGSVPACSSADGQPTPDREQFGAMFGPQCLTTLESHLPNDPASVYGGNYGPPFDRFEEQYYNCAVQMADYLRRKKGTVYVIGVGEQSEDFSEPYQSTADKFKRKDVFLTRLANHYSRAYDKQVAAGEDPHPEFTYDGYQTYAQLKQASAREGYYSPVEQSEFLTKLKDDFMLMAIRIQLRLVD